MHFQLSFDYPIWAFALVLLSGLTFASVLYLRNKKEPYGQNLNRLLFLLRFIGVSCITFLLLGPFITQTKKQIEPPTLIFVHDNSASIALNNDSAYYKNVYPGVIDSLTASLATKYNIEFYQFGQIVAKKQSLTFTDQQTDIAEVFRTVQNNYYNRNIGAIVLFTDGIYNKGTNPAYAVESLNIPVIAIPLGDTVAHPDVTVFEVRYNKKVFYKSRFTVETTLRASQLRGNTAILELFDGSKKVGEKRIPISANKFSSTQYFLVDADKIGYKQLTLNVNTTISEKITNNNKRQFFVDVVSEKHKVLIYAKAPHPDIAAIRSSLGENFESKVKYINEGISNNENYDLIILHQLPSGNIDYQMLETFLTANKQLPVMYVVGPDTDLSLFNKLQAAIQIQSGQKNWIDGIATVNKSFGLFRNEITALEKFEMMPPLISPFGEYVMKLRLNSLFNQKIRGIETKLPMISFVSDENRKLGFIFGTGIWRWRLAMTNETGNPQIFDQIVTKSISFLIQDENKNPLQIIVNESFNPSDEIIFKALLYNKTAELVNDPELKIEISDADNTRIYPFVFAQHEQGYELNAGRLGAGTYSYTAQTTIGGELIKSQGKFTVENNSAEGIEPVADHRLLCQIANQTGGSVIPADSLQYIPVWLENQKNITSVAHYSDSYQPIINYAWALIICIILLFAEWLLRKMFGSY
ncbi:MAG: hypothetical protein HOO86_01380 [Bacteroidales bacterium]|nr:hypothetical protein [Bacteroidales bacterium]